jgi:hypothetical protein
MPRETSRFNIDADAFEVYRRRINQDVKMRLAVLVSAHVRVRHTWCQRGVRRVGGYLRG